ncbi:O-antigen/teichoic acid export membrane protein [Cytobacillus eiseniae]|uniref:O-antigen/teichoic acid export membrane protein n=1 Tax=Cytobacillus eiseniae TaxID=762947 RepID=A0ABS4RGK5_9BACI|nr:lipopolysaccharide biosynthesis protein [Cytobacillus eiseniae]MBP2241864.1 O-antigen/teichoic acid export membrane protein [Cytobacillus eiseniae]
MKGNHNLKEKTVRGLFWSILDLLSNQGIQFLIQIILARLLLPEHFGLIGLTIVFIAISNAIIDGGISQALIREQKVTQTDYSTIFYFNLLMSCAVYAALFTFAPMISTFFKEPQLILILRLLSLGSIIHSFSIIQKVQLTKNVDFKRQTKVSIISSVASGIIAVICAFNGFGVWAIVIQTLSMQGIQSILLWLLNGWRPSFVFSYSSFKRFFKFGSRLLAANMISTVYSNIFYLLIGRMYSSSQLGYYTNAVRLSEMASFSLTVALQRVTYPVFSRMQDNQAVLRSSFKRIIKITTFVNFPIMAGLAAIAPSLIHLLFGEKWMAMVIYFQLLCLSGMLYHLHAINLNILQVKGRSDLFLQLSIVKKVIFTFIIIAAVWANLGMIGLVGAAVLDSYLAFLINSYYSGREISYSTFEQIKDLLLISLNTFIMAVVVYASGDIFPDNHLIKLIMQICLGCFVYIALSKVTKSRELMEVWTIVLSFVKRGDKKMKVISK